MDDSKPHFLPGVGKRTGHQRVNVIHYVLPCNGDNFNTALCGKKPKGKSLGWCETSFQANCEKCIHIKDNPSGARNK